MTHMNIVINETYRLYYIISRARLIRLYRQIPPHPSRFASRLSDLMIFVQLSVFL